MMYVYNMLLLLCLMGCATINEPEREKFVTPNELIPYVLEFNKLTGKAASPMTFGRIDEHPDKVIAVCYSYDNRPEWNHIVIRPNKWDMLTELEKLILVLHEQGHCRYGFGHGTGIMDKHLPPAWMIEHNFAAWLAEYLEEYK